MCYILTLKQQIEITNLFILTGKNLKKCGTEYREFRFNKNLAM